MACAFIRSSAARTGCGVCDEGGAAVTWIFHPWALGALLTALGLAGYLIATVRVRVRSAPAGRLVREIDELRQQVDQLAARQLLPPSGGEPEGGTGERALWPLRSGMNLTRRSQALRLHRRGETPEQIAATLMVPTGEVRLLLKVHRLTMERTLAACPGLKSGVEPADTFHSAQPAPSPSSEPI